MLVLGQTFLWGTNTSGGGSVKWKEGGKMPPETAWGEAPKPLSHILVADGGEGE